jgi:hypothetical protein
MYTVEVIWWFLSGINFSLFLAFIFRLQALDVYLRFDNLTPEKI